MSATLRTREAVGLGMMLLVLAAVAGLPLTAWILMLLLGALHHSVTDVIPALGYWACVLVVAAIGFLKALIK